MTWTMYRWVWQVVSPLHIGMPPAGALNRTRLYIPARALWGAFTAELARRQSTGFPGYRQVGRQLQEQARLSYLFPAEEVQGQWLAWLPCYKEGQGLVWRREDGQEEENRRFRLRILITRPGTAIDPATDTAAEGTLREFELISSRWRPLDEGGDPQPVGMVGYLFCKDPALYEQLEEIREIFVGGDTRYGLGRLQRVHLEEATQFFDCSVDLSGNSPKVRANRVLAHTLLKKENDSPLVGSLECIAGWDTATDGLKEGKLTWAPGSSWQGDRECSIQEDGLWNGNAGSEAC
ncbi:hypothetical protein Adeg_0917 [Ammonifex degensii KC4]|uniref:CRISPR-associated RAMP protein, Cmr4 family n=1 Tax=Ammonifex degensii (strain DSM 10501 / KC4) TaxID=429009 RepID=C9RCS6_AMMDK|nr:RAMP superfamily CRISPR-associated protein [Ammonifex degensii]ACX52053.1 hypothetical protein Adeg_0917 [Ammonifex degensii KC4]